MVLAQTSEIGNVLSPFLSNPNLENRFLLIEEFNDYETAIDYFNGNTVYNNEPLQQFALNIVPNQIWLIKTNSGQFGKLLTIKTKVDVIDDNKPFAELEFKIAKIE